MSGTAGNIIYTQIVKNYKTLQEKKDGRSKGKKKVDEKKKAVIWVKRNRMAEMIVDIESRKAELIAIIARKTSELKELTTKLRELEERGARGINKNKVKEDKENVNEENKSKEDTKTNDYENVEDKEVEDNENNFEENFKEENEEADNDDEFVMSP
ncbi:uncharacterized protein LOC109821158 [Asparagus officinalis]|uniref:uncharacterized protein LOC109821158 n=1 Tax=Asparagus officinalis TaxID=4686 RepID=UPI00098DF1D8|nr:uncharacterized protein LOC109821158 [Asparagus officinalis]